MSDKLREALEAVLADIKDYERVNNLAPSPGKLDCWQSVTRAKAALAQPQNDADADWSDLPKDIYVTSARRVNNVGFDVQCCSVPMVMAPEVRYVRSDMITAPPSEERTQVSDPSPELAQPQSDAEACALAHITLEDDGPYIKLEVLDGTNLQPEMSPVRLYTAPPPELERMRKALEKIASFSDTGGNEYLARMGSYVGFNEPYSVKIAREALSRAGDNHASDGKESEGGTSVTVSRKGIAKMMDAVENPKQPSEKLKEIMREHRHPSDPTPAQERREEPVAWRYRSIFNEYHWCLVKDEPDFDNDQYIKEPLFRASISVGAKPTTRDVVAAFNTIPPEHYMALPPAPKGEPSQEWKPIDTAPRNLVVMLAWSPDDWTVGQGFYRGDRWVACGCFFNPTLPHPGIEMREMYPEPTHWQHIPEPPALRREPEGGR